MNSYVINHTHTHARTQTHTHINTQCLYIAAYDRYYEKVRNDDYTEKWEINQH